MISELEPNQAVQPDRGGTVLALGALSLLTGLCGLPLGIVPWVVASRDLKAMRGGRMDNGGRRTTQAGKVLSIAGVARSIPALLVLGGTVATPKTLTHAHVVETTR